ERFGLVSQIRRASASIPTNVAEDCGRSANNELARFIDIATAPCLQQDAPNKLIAQSQIGKKFPYEY
ncbi:MAG: four helix bundle protein, partial [Candidatus Nealsonbacteria bacterium]|nr:four helix bundle protein [Candidatus Nealsonbacteria bacterium]